jgi:hypothetical protein
MMSVGRRVEFEFRVRSCALYAKQQSLPFQFADLEDSPYVSMSDQGERQSATLFTTTALRRQLLNYWKQLPIAIQKQWDLKAAGRRRSGLFNV